MSLSGCTCVLTLGWCVKFGIMHFVLASGWHSVSLPPICMESLLRKATAGGDLGSNWDRFFKESHVSFTRIQLPANVSPEHSVSLPRPDKILLPDRVPCRKTSFECEPTKSKWKLECQRTREQIPGVSIVIISINISHVVVFFKLTQEREDTVNNLKTNTEQMSPCLCLRLRKICTVGITSLRHTFSRGHRYYYWGGEIDIEFILSEGEGWGPTFNRLMRLAFESMQLSPSLVSPGMKGISLHTGISVIWLVLCRR